MTSFLGKVVSQLTDWLRVMFMVSFIFYFSSILHKMHVKLIVQQTFII